METPASRCSRRRFQDGGRPLGEIVPPLTQSLSKGEAQKDDGSRLRLRGLVADPAGGRLLRGELEGAAADAEALGVRLAETLLEQGAAALLETVP